MACQLEMPLANGFDFALSGEEALKTLARPEPLAVLSDINMPGASHVGVDLLVRLRTARPGLPVVMITAYGDRATEAKIKALGARALMPKPVDFGVLKERLSLPGGKRLLSGACTDRDDVKRMM